MDLLGGLNPAQRAAASQVYGPLLISAGAGSGKTRVLTHRVAHMIEQGIAFPGEICALTFTNKAANVMRERIERLLGRMDVPVHEMLVATFHSLGARLLRKHGRSVGLERGFSIFDDSDQQALIKECLAELNFSEKMFSPRAISSRINQLKNEAIDPLSFQPSAASFFENRAAPVIRLYENKLRANNACDFGDLIFKTWQLFESDRAFSETFQEQYRFVLVDEYQDTNAAQYKLLRCMTDKHKNLCVVGDEDQSIYGWRGADIRNILEFERDFSNATSVKLEENYRSTAFILRAANKVISNNTQRKDKALFTSLGDGNPVEVHALESDFEEARFVVRSIQQLLNDGASLSDIAVFYRTNAQSRLFEDRLRSDRLNYKIFGGPKFYDRAEIKDALAYLRCLVNPKDEVALSRIINVPARGIGKATLDQVRNAAFEQRIPFLEALGLAAKGDLADLGSGPRKKIAAFLELHASLSKSVLEIAPFDVYSRALDESGYLAALKIEESVEAEARIDNLKELGNAVSEFQMRRPDATIADFIEEVALVNEVDTDDPSSRYVSLMTIHSAKGLEFKYVFLVGLEEELFPSVKPDAFGEVSREEVEEERRICYVGITRAEKRLWMTHARVRRVFGVPGLRRPSRFLAELPQEEVRWVDHGEEEESSSFGRRFSGSRKAQAEEGYGAVSGFDDQFSEAPSMVPSPSGGSGDSYGVGVFVRHPDYGDGKIVAREGNRDSLKVTIRFQRAGLKKFVVKYAPLELIRGAEG